MHMTHVRPLEVDDLHDVFGTDSRVRDASFRTERRALRRHQQQHYHEFVAARDGLRVVAEAQGMQLRAAAEAHKVQRAEECTSV